MVLIQIDCLFFFIFFFNCFVVSCLQYPETMLRDFPSLMIIQIHPRVPDPNTAKRLIGNMLSLLQEAGMFTKKQMHTHTYYTDQTNIVCATNHCLAFLVCPVYTVQLPSFLTQIYSAFLPQAPLVFFASSDLMTEECWTFSGPWACSTCLRWKDYNQAWSSWEQSCE